MSVKVNRTRQRRRSDKVKGYYTNTNEPWRIKLSYTKNFGYTPLIRLHNGSRFTRDQSAYHEIERHFTYSDVYKLLRKNLPKHGYDFGHDFNERWIEHCAVQICNYLRENGSFVLFIIDRITASQKTHYYNRGTYIHFFMPPTVMRGGINAGKYYSTLLFELY